MEASYLFFFFQAEDGIRDVAVTGVQTCALPISVARPALGRVARGVERRHLCAGRALRASPPRDVDQDRRLDSECRRGRIHVLCAMDLQAAATAGGLMPIRLSTNGYMPAYRAIYRQWFTSNCRWF